PLLVDHFLAKYSQENNKEIQGISRPVLNTLWNYNWPGNIRELENAIERAVALCRGKVIDFKDLPSSLNLEEQHKSTIPIEVGMNLKEVEREVIRRTLSQVRGKRMQAAKLLRIDITTLYRKLKELELG
ncbi:sigma-54-dependent Fis family transcriptional regulator, partial [candidate division NPL-UPA2 bacterium]|nr:sigma-54-dependent Fis family transcriptional regulator [candidate division NPL-UPA2 bacterium]